MTRSPMELGLQDFYLGDDQDPLRAPPEFVEWRHATRAHQALFERPMAEAAGPRMTLAGGRRVVNMASLDYLGLCRHPDVVRAQRDALLEWGNGAAGVPLLSGTSVLHEQLEAKLCGLTGHTGAVLFTSGFAGAIGLASGALRRGDVAVLDEKTHISWMDGVRMAGAKLVTFEHNRPESLDAVLTAHRGRRRVVIVDGLYSMDGDFARLPELLDVAEHHGVGLVVDEAHSIFATGRRGGGVTERQGVESRVRGLFGTFSKALSMVGGFVAADEAFVDYLKYYSHPYVFSGALPPALVAGLIAAIDVAEKGTSLRVGLEVNAEYFRSGLETLGLSTGASQSWVVPIVLGRRRELLFEGVLELEARGLYVAPVDYPAVPEDQLRIRCAVSAAHRREDLDEALNLIEDVIARPLRRDGRSEVASHG